MSSDVEVRYGSEFSAAAIELVEWREQKSRKYGVLAVIGAPEPEGIPVYTPSLPGVSAYGDSEAGAIRNLGDAIRAAIESYQAESLPVPWVQFHYEPETDGKNVWIEVDA